MFCLVEHDPAGRVERVVAGGRRAGRRAAGSAARATRPGAGTARSPAARSDPRRARRAPGRAARPACSRARARRRRSARRARCRRGARARRSPPRAAGRARRRRASWRRRRSSGPAAGTACRSPSYQVSARDVAVVDEHVLREPVLRLARQPVAALEQEDPLARGREVAGDGAAARAGSDDDHVVRVHGNSHSLGYAAAATIPRTSGPCIVRTG